MTTIDGRVAIVTGTSSGLGRRFAEVLDGAGARVVLASRRHQEDLELAGRLRDALPVACDVRSPADRSFPVPPRAGWPIPIRSPGYPLIHRWAAHRDPRN